MSMARSIIPLQSDVAWSHTLTGPMVLTYLRFVFFQELDVGWFEVKDIYIECITSMHVNVCKCMYIRYICRTGTSMTIFVVAMWVLQGWPSTVDIITWVLQFYRWHVGMQLQPKATLFSKGMPIDLHFPQVTGSGNIRKHIHIAWISRNFRISQKCRIQSRLKAHGSRCGNGCIMGITVRVWLGVIHQHFLLTRPYQAPYFW